MIVANTNSTNSGSNIEYSNGILVVAVVGSSSSRM